jgi:hypothetical protein
MLAGGALSLHRINHSRPLFAPRHLCHFSTLRGPVGTATVQRDAGRPLLPKRGSVADGRRRLESRGFGTQRAMLGMASIAHLNAEGEANVAFTL